MVTSTLNLPCDKSLPGDEETENVIPYVILADDAFPMKRGIMKPYAQQNLSEGKRIFNYRLSRGRRTVENAFGILTQVFRIFFTTIEVEPWLTKLVTVACCILHNLLRTKSRDSYTPNVFVDAVADDGEIIDGRWRNATQSQLLFPLQPVQGRKAPYEAEEIRDYLREYFQGNGSVSWQYKQVYN